MKSVLGIPGHIDLIAYLCIGWVGHFFDQPELETAGWRRRLPLADLVHGESWDGACDAPLAGHLDAFQEAVAAGRVPDSG
ncbi:MAG: hypothetical protein OXR84_13715 [Magnetovibrio sp.]|nr:hypothetical protein [Magnetovibrio sp.]